MGFYGADPIHFESVSAVTATNSVELGTLRMHDGEWYEYVYAIGCVSMGVGATYSGTSGNSVVATGIVSGEYCAGFVKHESITTGKYGWLMKKGVIDVDNGIASSAPADGDVVYLSTDGKFIAGSGKMATAATDFIGGHVIGKVLSAGASGGTGASFSLLYISVF